MGKDSFIFYRDWLDGLKGLDVTTRLELLEAIINYGLDGKEMELSAMAKAVFGFIKPQLDRNADKYEQMCERNRANGRKGGRPKKTEETQSNPENPVGFLETQQNPKNPLKPDNDNDNDNDNDIEKKDENKFSSQKKYFRPPSVDEVEQYCRERGNGIDADAFVSFYESKGWMIGKNKMKDWRAAVRTWERKREPINITTNGITTDNDRRKIERAQRDAEAVAVISHLLDTNTVDAGAGGRTEDFSPV